MDRTLTINKESILEVIGSIESQNIVKRIYIGIYEDNFEKMTDERFNDYPSAMRWLEDRKQEEDDALVESQKAQEEAEE